MIIQDHQTYPDRCRRQPFDKLRAGVVGETRLSTGNMFTDRLFTGQRQMAGLGIYQFGARFYSPKLGRFLSADTIVPGFSNPQAFNRYSYALNNPVRYNDPSGHSVACSPIEGDCVHDYSTQPSTTTSSISSSTTTTTQSGGRDDRWDDDAGSDGGGGSTVVSSGSTNGTNCDVLCQSKNLYDQYVLGYQYTPIAASSIQFITGTWMLWTEAAMAVPQLTPIAAPLYFLSYAENRAASFVGWQAVDYQYDHGLYDVTQTDTYIAGGSLLAGSIWPPLAPYVSDISFIWDITHTNWQDFP